VHPKSEKAKGSGREPEKTCAKQGQKSDLQARFTKKVALVEVNPESEFAAQDRGTDSGINKRQDGNHTQLDFCYGGVNQPI
jgi:hypothetical protein